MTSKVVLIIVLVGVVISLMTVANYRFSLQQPGGNDFLARWTGAHYWLVRGTNPYDPEVSVAAQRMIYGRAADPEMGEDVAHFVYPLPAMLFFGPFGLLSYPLARALWMTLLEIGLPVLVFLSLRTLTWSPSKGLVSAFVLFSIFWYHGVRAIIVGQFAILEAVLMVLSLLLYRQRRDLMSGVVLALTIAKPQMAFLYIPCMILHGAVNRRWRFVLSAGMAFIFLMLLAEVLLPGWIGDWLRQLQEYPAYTSIGSPVSIMAGFLPVGRGVFNLAITMLLAAGLLWSWLRVFMQADDTFLFAVMLTLVVTNLVAFRTATTNYVVLLPVLLYIFRDWSTRHARMGTAIVFSTLLVLLVGIWILFLTTVDGNVEGPLPYLPLPLFTLLGLLTTAWRSPTVIETSAPGGGALH